MSHSPFRKFGRFLLAACAVSLGSASLSAQQAPATAAPSGPNPSRVDVFMGYSYYGAHGTLKPFGTRYSSVDEGAALSGAYYFNKYAGIEVLGIANPDGNNDGFFSGSAGPIFRAPMQNFTLFAHGLAGGVRGTGPDVDNPALFEHNPYTWGVTLTAGGGMDYDLPFFNHKFGLRVFEADYNYKHIDFGPATASIPYGGQVGGRANLSGVDLSTGILMHFGHILPPPQLAYACAVTQPTGTIYPGDTVELTGTLTNAHPKKTPTYTWMMDSGPIPATSNVATFKAPDAPNTYTVKGHVTEGKEVWYNADCTSQFTVKQFDPPTVSCSATPSSVMAGTSVSVTAAGVSPQNRPLTYSYSATAGSISGNTGTTTLDTTGVAPGSITVTCNVVDDKGQAASQMATVTIQSPPPVVKVIPTKELCSISFDRDGKRPTRVNNEAKACLDDITLAVQNDATSKLLVTGNADPSEKMPDHKAAERAVNEKAYLVGEKGLDASRIMVYTGTAGTKTASNTLVPTGADMPTVGTPVDESAVKAIPRTAPVARKHKKHKK